jgi:hypothetical protein
MEDLDFLDSATAEEVATPEAQAEPVVTEEPKGPERGPDGKFVAKEAAEAPQVAEAFAEATPAPEPTPAPQVEARPEAGHVPITALLEERERRQAMEAQLRTLQQHVAQQQQPAPNPEEDLTGWVQHQQQQTQQSVVSAKLQISEDIAIERFGEQLVREADAWALEKARQMPGFQEHLISQRNPYGYLVQMYQREKALEKIDPAEMDQYLAWKAAQSAAAQAQPAAPAATPQPSAPPRSIASLPSAGGGKPGDMPLHEGAVFDQVFK